MRVLIAVLFVGLMPAVVFAEEKPEPRIPERESDYGELFPFGVRGLPGTYREVPGGDARLEAMQRGVEWLVAHQAPDGSFPADNLSWCNGVEATTAPAGPGKGLYTVGVSGMAISAILGAGYTPRGKHRYAIALRKGLQYLIKVQDPEGCFGQRRTQQYLYNHAFALLAAVDAYGVTGDPQLKQVVLKGIAFTELARNPGSAWRYGIRPGDNDTSLTGCMSLPLVAAHKINLTAERVGYVAPFDIPTKAFAGARRFIEQVTDPEYGMVGYLTRGSGSARPAEQLDAFPAELTSAMTAIGMLVRLIVPGEDSSHDVKMLDLGMKLMMDTAPRWTDKGTCDFYYWYYGSLATAALGGSQAEKWQGAFARAVIRSQRTDGGPCLYAGSWDPAGPWGPDGGRIYSTAILMLALQAPDRMRRFTRGRKDLTEALLEPELEDGLRARIVSAVGHHRVTGGERALTKALEHKAATVRVAAATALGKLIESTKAVRVLVAALGDKEVAVQRAAAQSLANANPLPASAFAPLLQALKSKDAVLRAHVATALGGGMAEPTVGEALRGALKDVSPLVRVAAAGSLWAHQADTALLPHWVEALKAEDPDARAAAATWLGRAGAQAKTSADALRAALGDKVPAVRVRVALALQAMVPEDPKLVDTFTKLLGEKDPRVRMPTLQALTRLGPRAKPATLAITEIARNSVLPIQRLALDALAAIGSAAEQAAPALWYIAEYGDSRLDEQARSTLAALKLQERRATAIYVSKLDFKDNELAWGAIAGLRAIGAPAVPALNYVLSDKNPKKQAGALRALAGMGEAAYPTLDRLRSLLSTSKDAGVREWSARAIGGIGAKARAAVSILVEHLDDRKLAVAVACAHAIGSVGPDSEVAVEALEKLLRQKGRKKTSLRVEALRALGKAGEAAAPVLDKMTTIASDTQRPEFVRNAAVAALVSLGPVALPRMKGALKGGNNKLAQVACQVLRTMGPKAEDAIDELIYYMTSKDAAGYRYRAADALGAIGKPALRPLLKQLKSPSSDVRAASLRAIGRMGPVAKSYAGTVKRMRKDPDKDVRKMADWAYGQLKKKKKK